ncbi:cytochrome P450 alkane hydroxylase [Bipolaris maydis]|nr:cytochrome P450 alkane hydroxylase [Bipolaris maydis]KAJ6284331.1 cytochrome P450 [Bipolaris maydis]
MARAISVYIAYKGQRVVSRDISGVGVAKLYKRDRTTSIRHGCRPPPTLHVHWPFGLDRLKQMVQADAELRLMELFLFHFRQIGSTLEQKFLGTKVFGTMEPANLEAILSTQSKDFGIGARRDVALPMLGDGIFTQEGPDWKRSRDLLRPQLHHKYYSDLEMFRDSVDELVQAVREYGGTVDLQPLFFRMTFDTTTSFLFGKCDSSLNGARGSKEYRFSDAFDTAQQWIIKRLRFARFYWLIDSKEFRQACQDIHAFVDRSIDGHVREVSAEVEYPETHSFMCSITKTTSNRTTLRAQAISILAAGRDTTASLLSWAFFLLVRHQQVMDKLRTEIAAMCVAGSNPTREDLRKMPYLTNVLKETLRLYPPIPVNVRTALKTTVLPTGGGPNRTDPVLVPEGSIVAFSVYSMHRRPDLYGMDAELFRPERWDEDMPLKHNLKNPNWGYIPFQGGPRRCPGADFALTVASYTIVRLLQRFSDIKLPQGERLELVGVEKQRSNVVLTIAEGCKVEVSGD